MKILIAHEKHGNRYYDASTPENLGRACLQILKERQEDGYYDLGDPPDGKDILSLEEIQELPRRLQESERAMVNAYLKEERRYKQFKTDFDTLTKIIAEGDWQNAYKCLRLYANGEYERISLEEVEVCI